MVQQHTPKAFRRTARRRQAPLLGLWLVALFSVGLASYASFAQAQSPTQGQTRRPTPAPKPICLVADFRSLALQTHDPRERAMQTRDWLRANGSACTAAQLGTLASNRAAWLGNADSPALMGMIDGMIESLEAKQLATASASATATQAKQAPNSPVNDTVTSGAPPPRTAAAPNGQAPTIAPTIAPVVMPVMPAAVPTQGPAPTPRP